MVAPIFMTCFYVFTTLLFRYVSIPGSKIIIEIQMNKEKTIKMVG